MDGFSETDVDFEAESSQLGFLPFLAPVLGVAGGVANIFEAQAQQKAAKEQAKVEQQKAQQTRNLVIGGLAIGGLAIVGLVVFAALKKRK